MQKIFVLMLVSGMFCLITNPVIAERYAQCDACGLCKDTIKTKYCGSQYTDSTYRDALNCADEVIYVQPQSWSSCVLCLYPQITLTPGVMPVQCKQDEFGRDLTYIHASTGKDEKITDPNLYRCDTIEIENAPNQDRYNHTKIEPRTGRMFSDIGCIGVGTQNGAFTDPNASVDVIGVMLRMIMGVTGAIGMIFILINAVTLATSQGNPEKIHAAKKSLTNTIIGLIFALFALFIFRFLAIQILRIPGVG